MKIFYLLFLFLMLPFNNLNAQWEQRNGVLYNKNFSSFIVVGDTIYAATSNRGFMLSTDKGNTWSIKNKNLNNYNIKFLSVDNAKIYVQVSYGFGTTDSIFVSDNYGDSWDYIYDNKDIGRIITSGNNIYVLSGSKSLQISEDYGKTWQKDKLTKQYLTEFAVNGNKIICSSYDSLFVSTDNGNNWTGFKKDTSYHNFGRIIYYGNTLIGISPNKGISTSTNDGKSWIAKNKGLSKFDIYDLKFDEKNIYVVTSGYIFLSTDTCEKWAMIKNPEEINFSNLIACDNNIIYRNMGFMGGFLYTTDRGTTWISYTASIPSAHINKILKVGSNLFACGDGPDIFQTTNDGIGWFKRKTGLTGTTILSIVHIDSNIFIGTKDNGVALSQDNGNTWTKRSMGLTNSHIRTLAADGKLIYAGTDGGGIFVSSDLGKNWSAKNQGLTNLSIFSFMIDGDNLIAGTYGGGVFISTDKGNSWNAKNSGLGDRYIQSLALNGQILYAGTQNGVYFSYNYGEKWEERNNNIGDYDIRDIELYKNYIIAGTGSGGVFTSTNISKWSERNVGLGKYTSIQDLLIVNDSIYAATDGGGIFKVSVTELFTDVKDNSYSDGENINIYPTPATDNITVSIPANIMGNASISIFNSLGMEVKSLNYISGQNSITIPTDDLAVGVYYLTLTQNEKKAVKSFVIIR